MSTKFKLGVSASALSLSLLSNGVNPAFASDSTEDALKTAKKNTAKFAADKIVDAVERQYRIIEGRGTLLRDGTIAPHVNTGRIYNELVKDILGKFTVAAMATGPGVAVPGVAYAGFVVADKVPLLNSYIDYKIQKTLKGLAQKKLAEVMESDAFYKAVNTVSVWGYDMTTGVGQREVEWQELNDFFNSKKSEDRKILDDLESDAIQSERLGRYWMDYIDMVIKQTVRDTLKKGAGAAFEVISKDLLNELDQTLKSYSSTVAQTVGTVAITGAMTNPLGVLGVPGAIIGKKLTDAAQDNLFNNLEAKRQQVMADVARDISLTMIAPSKFEIMRPDRAITEESIEEENIDFVLMTAEEANLKTYAAAALNSVANKVQVVASSFSQFGSALYNWWNPVKENIVEEPADLEAKAVETDLETSKVEEKKGWFHRWTGTPVKEITKQTRIGIS
jgi:hypothetical protein